MRITWSEIDVALGLPFDVPELSVMHFACHNLKTIFESLDFSVSTA
ncbi:MAG: hypothetical protein ACI814_005233, partial [Mariniblastus sp.]